MCHGESYYPHQGQKVLLHVAPKFILMRETSICFIFLATEAL